MYYANYIYKWLLSITLIVTLSAFSGVCYNSTIPFKNPTTEWVFTEKPTFSLNTTHYYSKKKPPTKKRPTLYSFNFDCFLNCQKSIFNNTFIAQNKSVLHIKNNMESHYLRIINTSNEYSLSTIS
ncbi:hypothetical protein D7030_10750 [Flavobacteriaceae bacterium AU392]|nr:hypothetical protein D1817_13920 [Flavobacteriaceae bacterium]RKM82644.1 hypothetical protein D7030_10750 [Flavobacteriaceae bacterium AU392]